jgi:hypothetical protein
MRTLVVSLTTLLLLAPLAGPLLAQEQGLTLAQVERKYRQMNEVHILKCDYDGNELFTRTEMLCVSGIYQQMYLDTD